MFEHGTHPPEKQYRGTSADHFPRLSDRIPFPYADLVETNRRRNREEMEYELLDTGVLEGDRYFDVFVEYAKGGAEDILVQITAFNRGSEEAQLQLLRRFTGPGRLRFIVQPMLAILLGVRGGLADAKAGAQPYLFGLLFDAGCGTDRWLLGPTMSPIKRLRAPNPDR